MGIDVHGLNFLCYAKKFGNFKKTITIGRQGLHLNKLNPIDSISSIREYRNDRYCERLLLDCFKSDTIDSIDVSSYEDASIIHDMNIPLPSNIHSRYDTVIDGGCLEHIYNINQALKNCSLLCNPGGQIIHMLPANNCCGHGLWQFSPELFFSLYSKQNGYQDTEVFLADLSNLIKWFKIIPPSNGRRVSALSSTKLYVLVRTVLSGVDFSHDRVQQSDYIHIWTTSSKNLSDIKNEPIKMKHVIKKYPLLYGLLSPIYRFYLRKKSNSTSTSRLNKNNPGLIELKVKSLL